MNNVIVECRNQDALVLEPSHQPGDWVTNIQERVLVEEGDSIICRNAFIDSRASSSQKIIIDEDIECKINFVRYLRNYRGAANLYTGASDEDVNTDGTNSQVIPINALQSVYVAENDNKDYIQCTKTVLPSSNYKYISEIIYKGIDIFNPSGGINLAARYFNESGVQVDTEVNIPRTKNGLGPFLAPVDIIYDASKTGASAPTGNNGKAIALFFVGSYSPFAANTQPGNVDTGRVVTPGGPSTMSRTEIEPLDGTGFELPTDNFFGIQKSAEFTIPKNNYDPQDLTILINRQLTAITPGTPSQTALFGDNPFLDTVGGNINPTRNQFVKITTGDVANVYGFNINNSASSFTQFVGTNQVVLSYDETSEKFFWEFTHFPIYDDTNGPGVAFISQRENPLDNVSTQEVYIANKNSGIIFTGFASHHPSDQTKEVGFFNDILGLDTQLTNADGTVNDNCILGNFTHKKGGAVGVYNVNGTPAGIPVFDRVPIDGKEVTGAFIGIDQTVDQKNGHDDSYKPISITPNNNTSPQFATSDKTIEINAVNSVLASAQKINFGYFLIEVQANFLNDFRTADDKKGSVVAIVSRYYELNSFTSSDSSNSVVYTHKGAPMMLSSFRCRILDSEKNLVDNIGNDNTLFMEIVKAPKVDKKDK